MKFDHPAARVLFAGSLAALTPGASFAQSTEDALRARIEQLDATLKALEARLERHAPPPVDAVQPAAAATAEAAADASVPTAAAPVTDAEVRQRLEALDQQVRVIGRKQELDQEAATVKARETPSVFAGKDGFGIRSADGGFRLRVAGVIHADARAFLDNDFPGGSTDNFVLRRVRPSIEGTFNEKFGFRIQPELGNSGAISLLDAHVDLEFRPYFRIRGGKFKGPVGLERLQSPADITFVERAFPTQLLPNRDIGVQVHGDVLDGRLSYAAGYFDGARDNSSLDTDTNSSKDFEGRLFAHPFRQSDNETLRGLGLGVAVTTGTQGGTVASSNLASYVTPGQQTFFAWSAGAFASGSRQRVSPQFYWYAGPFGLFGEYARVSHEVSRSTSSRELTNTAWQLYATWVITGEDAGYTRPTPRQNFDLDKDTWGAFEVGARVSQLTVDDAAFVGTSTTRFADPSVSARKATDYGLVLNWYLNRNVKLQFNYEQTRFDGGAARNGNLPDERVFFTRLQGAF